MKHFDLNIEEVLEDWEVHHALREIIANAIDEQVLTKTDDIHIYKDGNNDWHIRDFGRGLKYEHLTQNESQEKLANPNLVIGKFGVGLKDALATLDRHHIKVTINSKYSHITLNKLPKHEFEDILTLHAVIKETSDTSFIGTEFVLHGLQDSDMDLAKEFFLIFSDEELLEQTRYGQVLKKSRSTARIYINGVRVAEEENFLFSYNITSLTQVMRKALNRERSHVGRSAYTDRVKALLLECQNKKVAQLLVADLKEYESGQLHEELQWIDVSVHACKLLNASEQVIFLTSSELITAKDMVDSALDDGYEVIVIPENIKQKIRGLKDIKGNHIRDLNVYVSEWNVSFKYEFVSVRDLTEQEKLVFNKTEQIFQFIGGKPKQIQSILVSETMRLEGYSEALGVWEPAEQRIVIKRSQLKDIKNFAGTLLHEIAHARSNAGDISREFEHELTVLLGIVAASKIDKSIS